MTTVRTERAEQLSLWLIISRSRQQIMKRACIVFSSFGALPVAVTVDLWQMGWR